VEDLSGGVDPADVAVGLTWLFSLDPQSPLPWGWSDGTEQMVRAAGLRGVISNNTQWRRFRQWAVTLGIAIRSTSRGGPNVLLPDPTTAVADSLSALPRTSSAPVFLESLGRLLPTVDRGPLEPVLLSMGVSNRFRGEATIGPSLGYALRRLHHRQLIHLEKADDASHRVSFQTPSGIDTFDDVTIKGALDA
jgi:hypothetical protein